jgi:hypothetical protein
MGSSSQRALEMTFRGGLRGDVVQILNRMVRDGAIASFRTNFDSRQRDDAIVVTVTAPAAVELDLVEQRVRQALEPLQADIVVTVDLP